MTLPEVSQWLPEVTLGLECSTRVNATQTSLFGRNNSLGQSEKGQYVDETSHGTVREPGRADESTVPACNGHVRRKPNYIATNELPIRRIYCLVLSQELIKSTQLKAAVRETLAVSGPSIRLIHDCQLK